MKALLAKRRDYGKLCDELKSLLEKGRLQAEKAVSEIANRTYWKVGKRLDAQHEAKDAKTSAALISRLASDIGISSSLLYHALQFFRAYPKGLPKNPDAARLSWGSHVALLPLTDSEERLYYLTRAINEGWSRSRLRRAIRSDLYAGGSGREREPGADLLQRPSSALHTYVGVVERIIDGDTLEVRIDLGFDVWKVERLRLRGIDTPELNMPGGKEAKGFVEKTLEGVPLVAFKTYKADKYARYIADVFYDPVAGEGDGDEAKVFETGRFLNREILEAGHAIVLFPVG